MLLLSACGTVKIKDAEWCGDIGRYGATCTHTLNNKTRDIDKVDWDKERFGMLCTRPENFENLKTAVEQLCEQTKKCTTEDQAQMANFFQKMHNFQKKAGRLK